MVPATLEGLAGEKIPLASRIICVADSYSAMVSDRPYGPALSPEIGMAELELHKGTQFDPEIVDCFLAILESLDDCYRRGQEADFQVEVQAVKFLRDLRAGRIPLRTRVRTLGSCAPQREHDAGAETSTELKSRLRCLTCQIR